MLLCKPLDVNGTAWGSCGTNGLFTYLWALNVGQYLWLSWALRGGHREQSQQHREELNGKMSLTVLDGHWSGGI